MHLSTALAVAFVASASFREGCAFFAPTSTASFYVRNTKVIQNAKHLHRKEIVAPLKLYVEDGRLSKPSGGSSGVKALEEYIKSRGGNRVIHKVLIANNGMAATKSILSMRQWAYMELGDGKAINFVAMATPEDIQANAEFVRLADSFVEVPGGKNLNNYANVAVIAQVAKEQGVDAVWPGWGHASENPKLPTLLNELGIKFIGPTSPVMSVLGDKIAANILAQTAGLPSV
jgi:acetyl-CoA carboxylase/biotin carboxylase 1